MNTQMTMAEALNRAHHQLMAIDDRVVVIGEDIAGGSGLEGDSELGGVFGVTRGLAARFGAHRVIDTPISEAAFIGMSVGAAMTGLRPIAELMFCDFLGVAFDQIFNQAAKARFLSGGRLALPLVIRTSMGAGDGSGAMHSQATYGLLAQVPGLVVACPSTPADAAGLLKSALASPDPVVLFEHKGLYGTVGDVQMDLPAVPLGQGRLVRAGQHVTLIAVAAMVAVAEQAADRLAADGILLEIIDPRTIHPLDTGLITDSVGRTGHLLVLDEGTDFAGFSSAVIAAVCTRAFATLKAAPVSLTPPHTPVPYARAAETAWLPGVADVVSAVQTLCGSGGSE